ncbi:MAG: VanZ family protein [Erysipelotrichaceae bacterium]
MEFVKQNKPIYRLRKLKYVLLIVVQAFIWLNSMQNGTASSSLSSGLVNELLAVFSNIIPFNVSLEVLHIFVRKLAHFSEYALLGILIFIVIKLYTNNLAILTFGSISYSFIVACIDELIQTQVPGRSGCFTDVMIDVSGATIFILISVIVVLEKRRKEKKIGI